MPEENVTNQKTLGISWLKVALHFSGGVMPCRIKCLLKHVEWSVTELEMTQWHIICLESSSILVHYLPRQVENRVAHIRLHMEATGWQCHISMNTNDLLQVTHLLRKGNSLFCTRRLCVDTADIVCCILWVRILLVDVGFRMFTLKPEIKGSSSRIHLVMQVT